MRAKPMNLIRNVNERLYEGGYYERTSGEK